MMEDEKLILIVDDNPTNLNVLFEYLEESGFEVSVAKSGESAIQQIEQHIQPDLILLDVMMPGLDGFETCRKLKADKNTRDIPVIFMTALTDTVDKVKGFLAGGQDYITKPLQHEEVLARITAHLKIRKLENILQKRENLLKKKEEQLSEKTRKIEELEQCKQTFFGYISSELQQPINTLLGFTRMLLENIEHYSKEQLKSDILRLQDSAEKLYAQHANLLVWSKLQRGVIEFSPRTVNVEELVIYVTLLFTPAAKEKQISLDSDLHNTSLVTADDNMLNTVLHNLLDNAVKFTDNEGKVTVATRELEDRVEVQVHDNGIGMSQEQVECLFDARGPCPSHIPSDKEKVHLGLLLCKELVEKHGGKLRLDTQLGKGTSVIFSLPKAQKITE